MMMMATQLFLLNISSSLPRIVKVETSRSWSENLKWLPTATAVALTIKTGSLNVTQMARFCRLPDTKLVANLTFDFVHHPAFLFLKFMTFDDETGIT